MQSNNHKTIHIVCAMEEEDGVKIHTPMKAFIDSRLAEEFAQKLKDQGVPEVFVDSECDLDESIKRK